MTAEAQRTTCPVCGHAPLAPLAEMALGGWRTDAQGALDRTRTPIALGACPRCGHGCVTTAYTPELIAAIYANDDAPVYWGDDVPDPREPYREMIRQAALETIPEASTIIDVGCGTGTLLGLLAGEFGIPRTRLLGLDFRNKLDDPSLPFREADLTALTPDIFAGLPAPIGCVFASHLLEHLPDPGGFLAALSRHLPEGATLYAEVPDFSGMDPATAGATNLVNPQHVQYFSLPSLTRLVTDAGFRVVAARCWQTGVMPRLAVVATRGSGTAAANVHHHLNTLADKRAALAAAIRESLADGPVALWGAGGDLWEMLATAPDLVTALTQGRLALHDRDHAGRTLFGAPIRATEDLKTSSGPIFLTPLLGDLQASMRRAADAMGISAARLRAVSPQSGRVQSLESDEG